MVAIGTANSWLSSDDQVVLQSLPATEAVRVTVVQLTRAAQDYTFRRSDSFTTVCETISQATGIPTNSLRFIYCGREFTGASQTVAELGITDGSTLHMVVILRGR